MILVKWKVYYVIAYYTKINVPAVMRVQSSYVALSVTIRSWTFTPICAIKQNYVWTCGVIGIDTSFMWKGDNLYIIKDIKGLYTLREKSVEKCLFAFSMGDLFEYFPWLWSTTWQKNIFLNLNNSQCDHITRLTVQSSPSSFNIF